MLLATVGNNIRARRKAQKLSLMKLYHRCGIDTSNLQKIERAKNGITLWKLRRIARALNCSLYDLFTEKDGSHDTIDRFISKCLAPSPKLREAYPDPLLLIWLFDTRFLDAYTVSDIEKVANAVEEEEE